MYMHLGYRCLQTTPPCTHTHTLSLSLSLSLSLTQIIQLVCQRVWLQRVAALPTGRGGASQRQVWSSAIRRYQ